VINLLLTDDREMGRKQRAASIKLKEIKKQLLGFIDFDA
jgi:hypothetical protein